MHVDTDSWKLEDDWNYWGGRGQIWVWHSSQDSKIGWMSRRNEWNKLILTYWYKFRKAKSCFSNFFGGGCEKWAWTFKIWNSKSCCITKTKLMKRTDLLRAATNSGKLKFSMVKNRWGFRDHGTLKSNVSQWITQLNNFCVLIVMEWFLVWPSVYSVSLTYFLQWLFLHSLQSSQII